MINPEAKPFDANFNVIQLILDNETPVPNDRSEILPPYIDPEPSPDFFTNPDESIYRVYIDIIEQKNQKNNMFIIHKYKFPGPAPSNSSSNKKNTFSNKKHRRSAFDNILTKIQVNFINFLINLVNDAAKTEFDSNILKNLVINDFNKKDCAADFFRHINYNFKKKIDYNYITNIFQNPIKDIITLDISPKYKKLQSQLRLDYNNILYEKLIERSEWFKDFLDLRYIDVFIKYYYNKEKPLNKIEFQGKTIVISKNTKSFYHLLEKDKVLATKMIESVKIVYLNDYYYKNSPFATTKNDN